MTQQKFRPSLTSQQIAYLIALIEMDEAAVTETLRFSTLRVLKVFNLKMQIGAVSAAFTSTPRQSVEEQLGMDDLTPEEKREVSYRKWQGNPLLCTEQEVMQAKTYMYENNMMTDAEAEEFENGN